MQTKALRIAAYFLIAHFLIITALALLGRGKPDYINIAVTLGLLVGSVGSLFIPRKLGWVVVVAYAWYAANPLVMGLWAISVSPEVQSAAKIAASTTLALINLPLMAALVLVFKPANFASFTNPVPAGDQAGMQSQPGTTAAGIDAASTGKVPGMSSGKSHALGWTVAIVVLAAAALLAFNADRTGSGSQWMTAAQFQRDFDSPQRTGYYPPEIEGQCQKNGERFRADWKAIPPGGSFYAHFGMSMQDYDRLSQKYRSQGYALASLNQFKDCSGIQKYQATWLRK